MRSKAYAVWVFALVGFIVLAGFNVTTQGKALVEVPLLVLLKSRPYIDGLLSSLISLQLRAPSAVQFFLLVFAARLFHLIYKRGKKLLELKALPGWRLRDFAETVFSRRTYTLVFEPILSDLYDEYREALDEGPPSKARWVCIRGYWSFWSAVFAQMPVSAFKVVSQIWKATP